VKKTTTVIAVAVAALIAGCATPPGRIKPLPYKTNCPPVAKAEQRLKELSAVQQSAANTDAIGVFLIGLPLGSMSGSDNEGEIARLKACAGHG